MSEPMPERKTLLVVDDNPAFLDLITMVFGDEFEVLKAADGREGLEMARRGSPSLILLDVMMPNVSGVEMLRELQADLETRKVPVIVITASSMDVSTQGMLEREVNVASFLRKPCGVDMLRRTIRSTLDKAKR